MGARESCSTIEVQALYNEQRVILISLNDLGCPAMSSTLCQDMTTLVQAMLGAGLVLLSHQSPQRALSCSPQPACEHIRWSLARIMADLQ